MADGERAFTAEAILDMLGLDNEEDFHNQAMGLCRDIVNMALEKGASPITTLYAIAHLLGANIAAMERVARRQGLPACDTEVVLKACLEITRSAMKDVETAASMAGKWKRL